MKRIKKNDTVVVTTGRYKGQKAKVLEVLAGGSRVRLEGVDSHMVIKRHLRPNLRPSAPQGGIIELPLVIDASNVMLWDDEAQKGVRIGFKKLDDDLKVRVSRNTGKRID